MKISAIVFTFWPEEEGYIEACLKTISWADEIIAIDNGAGEATLNIVQKYTKKIHKTDSKDFSERHNLGSKFATGDWLLFIDSDERLSHPLKDEILTAINSAEFDAYQFWRVPYFLGKKVRFGDRNPDLVTRLFRKDKLTRWTGEIHESSNVNGKIGKLTSPFFHLTQRSIFQMIEKTINYSEHEAHLRFENNHPPVVWWRLIRVMLSEFYLRMVKYQGFRQGTQGWIVGLFQTFSIFIVYARLWELQQRPPLENLYKSIDQKITSEFL